MIGVSAILFNFRKSCVTAILGQMDWCVRKSEKGEMEAEAGTETENESETEPKREI